MISTICDDIMKTDFDLYGRVVEGFETEIVNPGLMDEVTGELIFCHDIQSLDYSLNYNLPVVCLGERWNGKGCLKNHVPDFQKLYVSDNLDELRWIIKNLLDKQP